MAQRILAVDDEEDFRLIIKDILLEAGYSVDLAADGEAALKKIQSKPPDLLLVDWMMPRMDGKALVERLRASPEFRELPILMLSTKKQPGDREEALRFGVDEYLQKPYQADELLTCATTLLSNSKNSSRR